MAKQLETQVLIAGAGTTGLSYRRCLKSTLLGAASALPSKKKPFCDSRLDMEKLLGSLTFKREVILERSGQQATIQLMYRLLFFEAAIARIANRMRRRGCKCLGSPFPGLLELTTTLAKA